MEIKRPIPLQNQFVFRIKEFKLIYCSLRGKKINIVVYLKLPTKIKNELERANECFSFTQGNLY